MTRRNRSPSTPKPVASDKGPLEASFDAGLPGELGAGLLAAAIFLALEAVVVGVLYHAHLTGPWELRVALTRILPIGVIAALPIALLSTAIGELLDARRRSGRVAVTSLAAIAALALGWGVTFGRHFQNLGIRLGFVLTLGLVIAASAWFAAPRVADARRRFPRAITGGCALLVVVCELVNQFVLPRLYPAFHIALSVLAVGLAAWLGRPLARAFSQRTLVGAALVTVIAATAVCPLATRDLRQWNNVRFLYVSKAPTLAHALHIAALFQPDGEAADPLTHASPDAKRSWISWQDRDFLLISIDALRADHVGAYGYERPTTPNIDALARRGVRFQRAYTVMPHTSYAMTSLFTGKYMRPLLLQDTGQDSETWAGLLRTYGYRTAAFFPHSLFAVDEERFAWAADSGLDFEYRKPEYANAQQRVSQAIQYLEQVPGDRNVLIWTHLFDPHEPYDPPPEHDFGPRDVDRYDGEVAATDAAVGKLVDAMLERRPDTVVILTADHGEAFGDHGSYYHGTTVYEEQVRVPLIFVARGLEPRLVEAPVQLIDVLPTVLRALDVPRRPRIRGNDLGAWLVGEGQGQGFAFSECHDQTLLAEGPWRLLCERKVDACSLFDLERDPRQLEDVSAHHPDRVDGMRQQLRSVEASHGTYERAGARAEGKDLPPPLVRGMAGDGDAARDVASLLDDADVVLRRKAGEVLFSLAREETAPALSLALSRDEDEEVRFWSALTLTRLGHGAPLTRELLDSEDETWRRLAALALAESGDARGERVLLSWWAEPDVSVERRKELARAFAKTRTRAAVVPLTRQLDNEQLRPFIAEALADIGDPYARIPLLRHFAQERYKHTRLALARALVSLGASREMAPALVRFLGVADPLEGGLRVALDAGILDAVGGPSDDDLQRLSRTSGDRVGFSVRLPKGGNDSGLRALVRARVEGDQPAGIRIGPRVSAGRDGAQLDPDRSVSIRIQPGGWQESFAELPNNINVAPGHPFSMVVWPDRDVTVEAVAVVPLADEIPPPAPEAWSVDADQDAGGDASTGN